MCTDHWQSHTFYTLSVALTAAQACGQVTWLFNTKFILSKSFEPALNKSHDHIVDFVIELICHLPSHTSFLTSNGWPLYRHVEHLCNVRGSRRRRISSPLGKFFILFLLLYCTKWFFTTSYMYRTNFHRDNGKAPVFYFFFISSLILSYFFCHSHENHPISTTTTTMTSITVNPITSTTQPNQHHTTPLPKTRQMSELEMSNERCSRG
jgi:hypothetical protein